MHVKNPEILIYPCVVVRDRSGSHVYCKEKCLSDVGEPAVRSYEREDLSGFYGRL